MSHDDRDTVSFEIDRRARLFALDMDRKGHVDLLSLFADISRVIEAVEDHPEGASIDIDDLHSVVSPDLQTVERTELPALLECLEELGYLEGIDGIEGGEDGSEPNMKHSSGSWVDYF